MRTRRKVVVIGAGIGGLTAAMLLAGQGCDVTVLDALPGPGGKLREVTAGGVRIDSGPTVLTMRHVFDGIFEALGHSFEDDVPLERADILARHHWENGTVLDLHTDIGQSAEAVGAAFGAKASREFIAFHAHAARVHHALDARFMQAEAPSLASLMFGDGVSGLAAVARIGGLSSLWRIVSSHFSDARLRQLFGRYATYCGASPYEAPGPLALIAHVEQSGVWTARDGMHSIATAMMRIASKHGAIFRFSTRVTEIVARNGAAVGVATQAGDVIEGECVIFNGDPCALSNGLLGAEARKSVTGWRRDQRSLSALTISMSAKAAGFPLVRHNVFFGSDYRSEFDDIFARLRLPDKPTVYLCAQDRPAADAMQPAAHERIFTIVNAPATGDLSGPTLEEIEQCTEATMRRLDRAGLSLDQAQWQVTGPREFDRLFPATGGALYGQSCHGPLASFRRPTARTAMDRLYLAGGAVHPGPGLPMAALSGINAARAVGRDLGLTGTSRSTVTPGGISTPSLTMVSTHLR